MLSHREKAAKALQGVVAVAAVDADQHKQLGGEQVMLPFVAISSLMDHRPRASTTCKGLQHCCVWWTHSSVAHLLSVRSLSLKHATVATGVVHRSLRMSSV